MLNGISAFNIKPDVKNPIDPNKAINPEMIDDVENGEMVWAEKYVYFEDGSGFEHRELYNNYCLTITSYDFDSLKTPIKVKEYFDPSVIFQKIYFHDQAGNLTHETSTGYLGASLGSKTYEYDDGNRRIKYLHDHHDFYSFCSCL